MKLYRLERQTLLATDLTSAWRFFSDPRNLAAITPPWLDFRIHSAVPERMYAGMLVEYRVHPLAGIPLRWITEITQVREPHFFIDEQRFGPYRFWHHQHRFEACAGGTAMTDVVHYGLPGDPFSRPLQRWLVAPRLAAIFAYRHEQLSQRLGLLNTAGPDPNH